MTALTLAMNEVQEVNSEDFVAVRAYHSLGAGFRHVLFDERNSLSPASSMSSGIESCSTTESERASKDSGNDSSDSDDKYKVNSADTSLAIIYDGRNILDLEKNIKPFTWQLSSFTQLSSPNFCFFNTPSKALPFYDSVDPSTTEICKNCSFSTPTDQTIPSASWK